MAPIVVKVERPQAKPRGRPRESARFGADYRRSAMRASARAVFRRRALIVPRSPTPSLRNEPRPAWQCLREPPPIQLQAGHPPITAEQRVKWGDSERVGLELPLAWHA